MQVTPKPRLKTFSIKREYAGLKKNSQKEIAEKQEKLWEFREKMSRCLDYIKEMREAEEKRQWYLNDLKVHPKKYVDRNGLRSKGMTRKQISSMKPLFWKGVGYGRTYYYSA